MSVKGPDERDPKVDAAWRELPEASPPPDLDDSIRAAARRAVRAKPSGSKARAPWPAWMTFAAAASIGVVAIGVWKMLPPEEDALHATASDVPVAAQPAAPGAAKASRQTTAATAPPSTPAQSAKVAADSVAAEASSGTAPATTAATAAPTPSPAPAPVATGRSAKPSSPTTAVTATQGFVPAPPPTPLVSDTAKVTAGNVAKPSGLVARGLSPPAGAARNAPAVTGRAEAQSEAAKPTETAAPTDAKTASATAPTDAKTATDSASASPPAAPAAAADKLVRSFDDYILAIRRALDARQDDEAVKDLQALRKAYPDADERMPVDLRSWAFRVRK